MIRSNQPHIVVSRKRKYLPDEIERIKMLAKNGKSYAQIAEIMGRTIGSINVFCRENNIIVTLVHNKPADYYKPSEYESVYQRAALMEFEKPSTLQLAINALQGDVKVTDQEMLLRRGDKFVPSSLNDVMRAANHQRLKMGLQQIDRNPLWRV